MAKILTLLQNWNYQLNDLKCIILQVQNQYKVKQSLFSTVASLWIRTRKAFVAFKINQQNKRSNAKQLSPIWIITLEYSESLSFNRRSKILLWTHVLKDVHPRVIEQMNWLCFVVPMIIQYIWFTVVFCESVRESDWLYYRCLFAVI